MSLIIHYCLVLQVDEAAEVMVAGDPERKHMALCDKLGGIPYKIKQIDFAVCIFHVFFFASWIFSMETVNILGTH